MIVVLADSVVEGLFVPPPPQPAARATSPATSTAAATCFDLGNMVRPILDLSFGPA